MYKLCKYLSTHSDENRTNSKRTNEQITLNTVGIQKYLQMYVCILCTTIKLVVEKNCILLECLGQRSFQGTSTCTLKNLQKLDCVSEQYERFIHKTTAYKHMY